MSESDVAVDLPRRVEPVSTTLARMEGKYDAQTAALQAMAKVTESNTQRLDQHDRDFESVRSAMQSISAELDKRSAVEIAAQAAVKEARAAEKETDEKRWTPKARFWTGVSIIAGIVLAVFNVLSYYHL